MGKKNKVLNRTEKLVLRQLINQMERKKIVEENLKVVSKRFKEFCVLQSINSYLEIESLGL